MRHASFFFLFFMNTHTLNLILLASLLLIFLYRLTLYILPDWVCNSIRDIHEIINLFLQSVVSVAWAIWAGTIRLASGNRRQQQRIEGNHPKYILHIDRCYMPAYVWDSYSVAYVIVDVVLRDTMRNCSMLVAFDKFISF